MLLLSLNFYVNIAFPYYLSQLAFLLLIPEIVLVGRGDKIWFLRSHQHFFFWGGAYSHGIFEDREFWVCVEWLCVLSPHTEWLSKIRSTHNTPWHLDLYSFQPRLSHTHQPRYHLSVTRTCSPFSHLQPCSCSSTDSSKLLDSLLPHTSPLSSLDLGIISPGKPSLCWSS